jgi:hypothetical protein
MTLQTRAEGFSHVKSSAVYDYQYLSFVLVYFPSPKQALLRVDGCILISPNQKGERGTARHDRIK